MFIQVRDKDDDLKLLNVHHIIEVYSTPPKSKVIATFDDPKKFLQWVDQNEPHLNADRVAINDQIMLGWDEFNDMIKLAKAQKI